MATLELVGGWTGYIDEQLLADGVAVDLTGCTVALLLRKKDGSTLTLQGLTSVTNAAQGRVRFAPHADDLDATESPYVCRWKVTDGTGKVVYFPGGRADVWTVYKP
jgi:hypothetical protein